MYNYNKKRDANKASSQNVDVMSTFKRHKMYKEEDEKASDIQLISGSVVILFIE